MNTFTLIVIICQMGAWSACSGGNREIRVEHIPTQQTCEEIATVYRKKYNMDEHPETESATCIPVVEK